MRSLEWTLNSCWWCSGPNYSCWLVKHKNTLTETQHTHTHTHTHTHSRPVRFPLFPFLQSPPSFRSSSLCTISCSQWINQQSGFSLPLLLHCPVGADFQPTCNIPCHSNLPGKLEGATMCPWRALSWDSAMLLFGSISSCRSSAAPSLVLYAPLNVFRCTSVSR